MVRKQTTFARRIFERPSRQSCWWCVCPWHPRLRRRKMTNASKGCWKTNTTILVLKHPPCHCHPRHRPTPAKTLCSLLTNKPVWPPWAAWPKSPVYSAPASACLVSMSKGSSARAWPSRCPSHHRRFMSSLLPTACVRLRWPMRTRPSASRLSTSLASCIFPSR
ncbi:hypothetical protein DM01DRAFT_1196289 [Hesseltinella vesiculosa]|uniref:Uncharacterized protein n=1 Tax=Hesseltinella vesiculosa TaxID=101127 RepID=A0A1X2G3K3_9FUNG|nr:hypothetical protein DM01DRAFT_1196289 [Hesseltinella vesiculosa]